MVVQCIMSYYRSVLQVTCNMYPQYGFITAHFVFKQFSSIFVIFKYSAYAITQKKYHAYQKLRKIAKQYFFIMMFFFIMMKFHTCSTNDIFRVDQEFIIYFNCSLLTLDSDIALILHTPH